MPSLFSRIISWNIPSYKIYENDKVYAFLDINPMQLGHTLVVPKTEVDHFDDVPEEYILEVTKACQLISKAIKKATGCTRVASTILWFHVPHFHQHLIPLDDMSEYDRSICAERDKEEMIGIQNKIVDALDQGK